MEHVEEGHGKEKREGLGRGRAVGRAGHQCSEHLDRHGALHSAARLGARVPAAAVAIATAAAFVFATTVGVGSVGAGQEDGEEVDDDAAVEEHRRSGDRGPRQAP